MRTRSKVVSTMLINNDCQIPRTGDRVKLDDSGRKPYCEYSTAFRYGHLFVDGFRPDCKIVFLYMRITILGRKWFDCLTIWVKTCIYGFHKVTNWLWLSINSQQLNSSSLHSALRLPYCQATMQSFCVRKTICHSPNLFSRSAHWKLKVLIVYKWAFYIRQWRQKSRRNRFDSIVHSALKGSLLTIIRKTALLPI